jgi:hypothetical protein
METHVSETVELCVRPVHERLGTCEFRECLSVSE